MSSCNLVSGDRDPFGQRHRARSAGQSNVDSGNETGLHGLFFENAWCACEQKSTAFDTLRPFLGQVQNLELLTM